MKIYCVGPLLEGDVFFPTKGRAIIEAQWYASRGGVENVYVIEHEIGRLTKTAACALASGRGYSKSQRQVGLWRSRGKTADDQ